MDKLAILILAAGKGERMKSKLPKVLHRLGGKPLLQYSLETAKALRPSKIALLVGHKADEVKKQFAGEKVVWVHQKQQLGTAHAVLCGLEGLKGFKGDLLILYGDVPLLRKETLQEMKKLFDREQASLALLTARMDSPTGYGRIIRDGAGNLCRIVEEKETNEDEKKISEINCGIYLVRTSDLLKPLQRVKKSIAKGEYYLTDLVEEFLREGKKVTSMMMEDSGETMGVNSRMELAQADEVLQKRIHRKWMENGVTLIHPDSIRIEEDVTIEPDATLHRGVILTGKTTIGSGAEILPYSVIEESQIGEKARIGPFAHIRPGSVIEAEAHVGNFVELKKTRLGKKAKANHLAYIGDAVIGAGANIGAGTITCNYDGVSKYKTVIGEGAFIGSDTQLIAPVKVGKKAYVGSGTTVTKDVPAGALAVSRVEQVNIVNWKRKKK
jgi:bifunctional UDP-N-acetylglucosamine pyrophosphorylase/glucosamine-1-phosphate N-acetyltransferase